jgi:hypothetical protein
MRVFVAGATGVIGQYPVPGLYASARCRSSTGAPASGWTPKDPSWRDGFPVRAEAFKSGKAA